MDHVHETIPFGEHRGLYLLLILTPPNLKLQQMQWSTEPRAIFGEPGKKEEVLEYLLLGEDKKSALYCSGYYRAEIMVDSPTWKEELFDALYAQILKLYAHIGFSYEESQAVVSEIRDVVISGRDVYSLHPDREVHTAFAKAAFAIPEHALSAARH